MVIARACVVLLIACGHPQSRADRWFAERGSQATTWHTCARLGASLRAACSGDAACEARVTSELTRPCYAARYKSATDHARPDIDIPPSALSPCFWQRGADPPVSPARYASAECATMSLDATLQPHCIAELRAVIEGTCTEGSIDLTGAGP